MNLTEVPVSTHKRRHRIRSKAIRPRRCIGLARMSSLMVDRCKRGQIGSVATVCECSPMPFQASCNVGNHEAKALLTSPEPSAISVDTHGHFADNSCVRKSLISGVEAAERSIPEVISMRWFFQRATSPVACCIPKRRSAQAVSKGCGGPLAALLPRCRACGFFMEQPYEDH